MEQLNQLKPHLETIVNDFQNFGNSLKNSVLPQLQSLQYKSVTYVQGLTKDEIVSDITQLKVTPITVAITITSLTSIILLAKSLTSKPAKPTKKKKRLTKAQKANRDIQQILDFVEGTYVPQIDEYIENYQDEDDVEYKYKYFEEMLLKEVMKLDSIDVVGNDVLKVNRKKVVKFIQDHQRRLDAFKKGKF